MLGGFINTLWRLSLFLLLYFHDPLVVIHDDAWPGLPAGAAAPATSPPGPAVPLLWVYGCVVFRLLGRRVILIIAVVIFITKLLVTVC